MRFDTLLRSRRIIPPILPPRHILLPVALSQFAPETSGGIKARENGVMMARRAQTPRVLAVGTLLNRRSFGRRELAQVSERGRMDGRREAIKMAALAL